MFLVSAGKLLKKIIEAPTSSAKGKLAFCSEKQPHA